jgi:hypothetical protein
MSKVVGRLLDRYFELRNDYDDAIIIWDWVKELNFHESSIYGDSESVEELRKNAELRQAIHRQAFGGVSDSNEADKIRHDKLGLHAHSHAGIHILTEDDSIAIVDHAYETGNVGLWVSFFPFHSIYSKKHKRNDLRFHMRQQALEKPEFMRLWMPGCRSNKQENKKSERGGHRFSRHYRKKKRRQSKIQTNNFKHLQENRSLIESGKHYGWLKYFTRHYLRKPESLKEIVDDETLPERALANGLSFIETHLPSLQDLVDTRRSSKSYNIEEVLYASCLAIYRRYGSLRSISKDTLTILKAMGDSCYDYKNKDEKGRFDQELNRQVFDSSSDIEAFAQDYLEPLLVDCDENNFEVGYFIDEPVFAPLFPSLALKWLESYSMMPREVLEKLFSICALHLDRTALVKLIKLRCKEFKDSAWDESDDQLKHRRAFWYLRYFFFVNENLEFIDTWLRSDPDLIFSINGFTDPFFKDDHPGVPYLTALKVFMVLNCFVGKWAKVHLPDSWGSESTKEERAYRTLKNILWHIEKDEPDRAIEILNQIIEANRFIDFKDDALAMRASVLRKIALKDFRPPAPESIVAFLDENQLATVEDLRSFLIEKLEEYQKQIDGGEFDSIDVFYESGNHVDETTACKRVADYLSVHLKALNMSTSIEHQLKDSKRCDITVTKTLDGKRRLLVIEAKGQWHKDLFSAAKVQLHERYSIHPDAENQGIYLVFWFGNDEKIAEKKDTSIKSATNLKKFIIEVMPEELRSLIDVFVLDLSRK